MGLTAKVQGKLKKFAVHLLRTYLRGSGNREAFAFKEFIVQRGVNRCFHKMQLACWSAIGCNGTIDRGGRDEGRHLVCPEAPGRAMQQPPSTLAVRIGWREDGYLS